MSRRTAVVLAYYFPPLAGIASERAAALTALLPATGWEPSVVTARRGHYHRPDGDPDRMDGDSTSPGRVIRTPSIELSRILRSAYAAVSRTRDTGQGVLRGRDSGHGVLRPLDTGASGSRLRSWVREFVYVPDAQIGWMPFATSAAKRAVRRAPGTTVLWSSSVPYTAHLAAMRVARRTGVPWVAEFRDPWTTAHRDNQPRSRLRRVVDRRLERRIVSCADHVIALSSSARAALLERHPDLQPGRVSVVTNGFVPAVCGSPPESSEPMSILYAGTVARGEDPARFLSALDLVDAHEPGSFRLVVLGPPDPWSNAAAPARGRPWLELQGVVSPARAREEIHRSSVLLLLQQHEAYRTILPGKSFEYIGSRRPILAVVPTDWELADLLRNYADSRFVGLDDRDQLAEAVESLVDEHRSGALQRPRVSEELTAPLRRCEQVLQLAAIFSRVCSDRA